MSQGPAIRKTLCALWLCAVSVCVGLNWTALQVVAWSGMTMTNLRTMDLSVAAEKAIEGQQTCVICRLLDQGLKTKPDSPLNLYSESELKAVFEDSQFVLNPLQDFKVCIVFLLGPSTHIDLPPLPPPEWVA